MTLTPQEAVKSRTEHFQKTMDELGINLAVIAKPVNFFHFSLFNSVVQSMVNFVLIPREGKPVLLVHALRAGHARLDSPVEDIYSYAHWGRTKGIDEDPFQAIRKVVAELGISEPKVGAELGFLSVSQYNKLTAALQVDTLTDITDAITREKLVKDALAIDRLKKAAVLANAGMDAMIASLREGADEITASNAGAKAVLATWQKTAPEYELTGFGTSEESINLSIHTTATSGARISFGADAPKAYTPQNGDLVLPISITRVGGYAVENERSLYVGGLSPEKEKIFQTVLEARGEVFKIIRPGTPVPDLYHAAANVFIKNGFGDYLPGRIGHGMGLSGHEWPSIAAGFDAVLQPGFVFTVEPGLMDIEFGGVRPSDTVLVTENGYELLTDTENGFLKI